jgi:hypothetical protein
MSEDKNFVFQIFSNPYLMKALGRRGSSEKFIQLLFQFFEAFGYLPRVL